jgi:hypothetical protein
MELLNVLMNNINFQKLKERWNTPFEKDISV